MPIAHINMLEGRTDAQKEDLIRSVTEAIMASLDAPEETIRVIIHECPKKHWGIGRLPAHKAGR